MQLKPLFVRLSMIVIVLLAFILFSDTANANAPHDSLNDAQSLLHGIAEMIRIGWGLLGSVGKTVQLVAAVSPEVIGLLACLIIPLAILGAWTLKNIWRILGLMALEENVHSFLHD